MSEVQSIDDVLTQIDYKEKKARSLKAILTALAITGALALVGLAVIKATQVVIANENLKAEKASAVDARERAEEEKVRAEMEETKAKNALFQMEEEKKRAEQATQISLTERKKAEDALQKLQIEKQRVDKLNREVLIVSCFWKNIGKTLLPSDADLNSAILECGKKYKASPSESLEILRKHYK